MRTTIRLSIAALCLLILPGFCLAEYIIEPLTPAGAKELGITMKSRPNGDAGTMVWLEFRKTGVLKTFSYAELRMTDAKGKHLLSATGT